MKLRYIFFTMLMFLVVASMADALNDVSDVDYLFVFDGVDGNGDIVNLGSADALLLDISGATIQTQDCASGYSGCSLTDGVNDRWDLNQTGVAVSDGLNITIMTYFKPVQNEASGDFFYGDNDALFVQSKGTNTMNMTYSQSGSYPHTRMLVYDLNSTWYVPIVEMKQNSSGWFACTAESYNSSYNCLNANGNYFLEGAVTLGDRDATGKATKMYWQIFAIWHRTLNESEKQFVDEQFKAGISSAFDLVEDTTPPDEVRYIHLTGKNNQSLSYSWIVDSDTQHTEIWESGNFVENSTDTSVNITGLTADSCHNLVFISVDSSGNKAINKTWFDCTLDNVDSIYDDITGFYFNPFLMQSRWQDENGQRGGEAWQQVFALDINEYNPNVSYICTDTTKCWRSIDRGINWYHIARNVTIEGASSIKSDPNNPNIVFAMFSRMSSGLPASTWEGLYKSIDAGNNWEQVITGIYPKRQKNGQQIFFKNDTYSYDMNCTTHIYAGADGGLYNSSNCGETWSLISGMTEYVNDISGDDDFAYVSTNESLYKLTFATNTLSKLTATGMTTSSNILRDCAINTSNSNNVICVATDVWESEDTGATFTRIYNPSPSLQNIYFDESTIIASPSSVGGNYPYYSTNGGSSFSQPTINTSEAVHFDFSWYFSEPVDCEDGYCLTSMDGAIAVSNDNGVTWHETSSGMTGARVMDIYFVNETKAYMSAWDYGLYEVDLSNGMATDLEITGTGSDRSSGCVAVNSTNIITTYGTWSTPDMDLIQSTDAGATWSTVLNSGGKDFYYCEFSSDNSSLVVADEYVSLDGGTTWSANSDTVVSSDMKGGIFYGYKDLGATTGIYNSTDGDNWDLIVSASCASPQYGGVKVDPFDSDHFLLPCSSSGIYECDGGSCALRDTAEGLPSTGNYKWVTFDPNIKDKALTGKIPYYASGFPAEIYISTNGGTNWNVGSNNLHNGTPTYSININPYTTNEIYLTGVGVWLTSFTENTTGATDGLSYRRLVSSTVYGIWNNWYNLTNNLLLFNLTFTQIPYIVSANVTVNLTNITSEIDVTTAHAESSSGSITSLSYSNDDNFATYAYNIGASTGYIYQNYTLSDIEQSYVQVYYRVGTKGSADYVKMDCWDGSSWDNIYNYNGGGDYNTWDDSYLTKDVPGSCIGANQDLYLRFTLTSTAESGGRRLWDATVNQYYKHYAHIENDYIYNSTNTTSRYEVYGVTGEVQNSSDDKIVYFTFGSYLNMSIWANVTVEYIYNKSIDFNIFDQLTSSLMNATCYYNNASLGRDDNFTVTYVSYYENILSCSEPGYVNTTYEVGYPYDEINFTMERPQAFECSGLPNEVVAYNFTVYDEDNLTLLEGNDMFIDLTLGSNNFSFGKTNTSNLAICIAQGQSYIVNGFLQLENGYVTKYFLRSALFDNETNEIHVYEKEDITDYSDMVLTVRDQNFLPYSNMIGKLDRYYPANHTWITVQQDDSDQFGQLFYSIIEKDVEYRLNFYENTTLLSSTSKIKLICDSGLCQVSFQVSPQEEDQSSLDIVTGFDTSTELLDVNWTDATGGTASVRVVVKKETMTGSLDVCDSTAYSSSGSYQCDMTGQTGSVNVWVYSPYNDDTPTLNEILTLDSDILGDYISITQSGFWSFVILLLFIGLGLISPVAVVIFTVFGVFIISLLGLNPVVDIAYLIVVAVLGVAIGIKVKK